MFWGCCTGYLWFGEFKYKCEQWIYVFSMHFLSDIYECSADEKSNSIVPIVVGASLAGLVVIVLIAYLIGRRRSRRTGYESV